MSIPRIVFDTNAVVSALLFRDGRLAWVRGAWADGRCVPLVSHATARELLAVLAYPKFALAEADRRELLAEFLPFCEVVEVPANVPGVPPCRDPADVAFLALAIAGHADNLVTGDRDLLTLHDQVHFDIVTPEEVRARLGEYPDRVRDDESRRVRRSAHALVEAIG